jgi:glycogen phosphorylase
VACAVRDIVRQYRKHHESFRDFPNKVAMQLNDTHPALAVAELMRMLVDENDLLWEEAWEITRATLGYTNHTLLPEALEKHPVALFEKVLPRHLQVIYEINQRFMGQVAKQYPNDGDRLRRMSLIEEGERKQVRMAHLAMVGSHSINGVAALHTHLLQTTLFSDFNQMTPEKFNNKTNGVTQRRWLLKANPALAKLLTESVGDAWITDLYQLKKLEPFAEKKAFQEQFVKIKRANKERLAKLIHETRQVDSRVQAAVVERLPHHSRVPLLD